MGRAALDWGVRDLAEKSNVAASTISRFERGKGEPQASTLAVIRSAFETAGIIFVDNGEGRGVKLTK